jgi:3-phosphoshikimate 1-carboxyvinyltransferase
MKVTIQPSTIAGSIYAPASKSSMQRACAAALLRKGTSIIHNAGVSNDDKAALDIIQKLGSEVIVNNEELIINSSGITSNIQHPTISCGESGLSIRMFTPIVALSHQTITINGTGSLLTRPMNFFDEILPQLSVDIKSNDGKLPLQVTGPLQAKNIIIDGSLSSQFLTGLLMAYSATSPNPSKGGALDYESQNLSAVTITVNNLKSKPYIDLTLNVMQAFGLNVPINNNYESFIFSKSQITNHKSEIEYTVEGDWSGGAFLLVAAAIASTNGVTIKGLDVQSTQADKKIIEALRDCGCNLSIRDVEIEISSSPLGARGLKAFHFNATDCPDLFPPLVALAVYCNGTTVIEGVSRLAHKESNRGLTLQEEFEKMGVEIVLQDDLMMIKGDSSIKGGTVHSHHDHRIAMACAVAALHATNAVVIEEADAINKSYPNFYEHLTKLGASVMNGFT